MKLAIQGTGWVTPLGNSIPAVWDALLRGGEATAGTISSELNPQIYPAFCVPESKASHPRLRRASAISRFAVEAGLAALQNAELNPQDVSSRMALVFATANGGVIYTKRFYHDIVRAGAQAASPLLFPEPVFNAPASHLAAVMGMTGATYTLVGDSAVGLLALKMAEDLMQNEALDYCLVVAAEEVDWLLCDAYSRWRLLRKQPPLEVFRVRPRGAILSEGAGAVLLGRGGAIQLDHVSAGSNFSRQEKAPEVMKRVLAELAEKDDNILIGSANGTFIDHAEAAALASAAGVNAYYTLKPALGEALAAGGLWQVIAAAQTLKTRKLPPLLHAGKENEAPLPLPGASRRALVLTCGLNQQVAGARLCFP
jgi:3-oxoacyl-(acyl-carrier-protein) synthase